MTTLLRHLPSVEARDTLTRIARWLNENKGNREVIKAEAAAELMKKATAWTASRLEYYQKLAAL
ncbi:MAG: hypothetical protein H7X83_02730 [Verrucomicrobia bacterium]|nr:hypothetical protein [Deltaproteobacteria bacterium]